MHRSYRKTYSLAASLLLAGLSPVYALDEIYSPNVEQGEVALEYNGSRTFDRDSSKNNAQEHELALEYGASSRWMFQVSGGFAKDPDNALKLMDGQIESRAQFFEQGANWVDSGLLVAYGFSTQSHTPDSLEIKLLLQKDIGRITSTANIGFTQTVGKNSGGTGGPDYAFLWNNRYRYNEYFQPGIEIQSDLGQGATLGHFNQQEHYIGPAVYGSLFGPLKYQVAYLFGASDAAAQGAGRVLLEYEMHF